VNYKNSVQSVYDKGINRADIEDVVKEVSSDNDILNSLIEFEAKIDQLAKRYLQVIV
jgi:hypothetical protein